MDLIFAIAMVILAIYVLFNGLLILGAVKKCRHLLIPYLCFETLMTIIACCSLKFSNYGGSESDFAGSIILNLMEIGKSLILLLVIISKNTTDFLILSLQLCFNSIEYLLHLSRVQSFSRNERRNGSPKQELRNG